MLGLWWERKIGTELFVTVATIIAFFGGEYVAAAALMTIILIAEYIADLNTDRARASIKALIGATPRTATVRTPTGEQTVAIEDLSPAAIVLVRARDRIPVDGSVVGGTAAVNEASITGESVPVDKADGDSVLAGTIAESGALDVRTERRGADTVFARIGAVISLVTDASLRIRSRGWKKSWRTGFVRESAGSSWPRVDASNPRSVFARPPRTRVPNQLVSLSNQRATARDAWPGRIQPVLPAVDGSIR